MNKKGFTLIELLVVIAIIGILSSIVLVALRGARNKAKDARITADLSQVRSLAEVLYDGTYDALLIDPDYTTLVDDIGLQGGTVVNEQTNGAYCVCSSLNESGIYCVDSTGYAGDVSGAAACTVCDAATDDCAVDGA